MTATIKVTAKNERIRLALDDDTNSSFITMSPATALLLARELFVAASNTSGHEKGDATK